MAFHFFFTALLLIAAIIDLKTMTIPPWVWISIALLAPVAPGWSVIYGLFGAVVAGAILLLPATIKPGAFGGGDIKLVAACGLCLGTQNSMMALWLAVTASLLPYLCLKRKSEQTHIAFAPYLAAGFIVTDIAVAVFF